MAAPKPSLSPAPAGYEEFRVKSPFAFGAVVDRPRIWVPFKNDAIVASLVGHGDGTPDVAEINTSEIAGFTLDADDESVSVLMPIPADIDLSEDIRVRVLCSNSAAAGTGSYAFAVTYTAITAGTTALAAASTSTGVTDGSAKDDVAANVLDWSSWSTIDGGTFSGTAGDDLWVVKVAVALTTITDLTVYGLQMEYYRKQLGGDNQ